MITLSASSLNGTDVVNAQNENLGDIKELMINTNTGKVEYAVLSFGGFLGMGDKYFAIPWQSLRVDTSNHRIVLDVPKEKLKNSPGFDKDNWPNQADKTYLSRVYEHYGHKPYWSKEMV